MNYSEWIELNTSLVFSLFSQSSDHSFNMVMRLDSPQPIFTFPDLKFVPDEVEDQPVAGIALVRYQSASLSYVFI